MAGKATVSSKEQKINQLNVQKSSYGIVLGMGWGRTRISCNLFWFGDFRAIAHTTTQSSGGKGGVTQKSTTYTYDGALILGLCEGPITGVRSVYRDKSVFTNGATTALAQAGLSLALGTAGQAIWGYLTTNHPTEAIPYSEVAYVYASAYPLGPGAAMPNHSFEVDFATQVSGLPDANPKDILEQFLAAVPGWQSGLIGSTTAYSDYCLANNILLSPYLETQQPAHQFITALMKITNSDVVWSEGVMKVVPYGDQAATGNGATFTPSLAPLYDLDDNHFMDDDEPVRVDLKRLADAWNIIQVEHLDRGHQYNVTISPASDLAAIDAFGKRKQTPFKAHAICEPSIGRFVAQLMLQREIYVRQTFRFRLGDIFCWLDPMDLVTITDSGLGLNRELVRIISIDEDEDGYLEIEAEQTLIGMASAPLYGSQGTNGYGANYDAAPGNVATPVVFNPPTSLTNGLTEVWAAVAGASANWGGCEVWASFDGTNYERVGELTGPARYGVTTATLPLVADPDTTSVLKVNLTTSQGALLQASTADADRDATLCLVGTELISYRDAVLTSAYNYDLDYLRRGRFGTAISSKASGTTFIRLDEAIFRLPYTANQAGATVRLKFLSFNVYGRARQSLADVSFYTVTPTVTTAAAAGVAGLTLTPSAITGAETAPGLIAAWTTVTDTDAVAVRIEYRPDGSTTSLFLDFPIIPGTGPQTGRIDGLIGQTLYEGRGAIIYDPPRDPPVFSAFQDATGLTATSVTGSVPWDGVTGVDFEPYDEYPTSPPNPN